MDCRTALEILDCAGPGVSDMPEARLAEAEAHAADCSRCATTVRNRRQLDLKIGRILRAVEVPQAAQDRLLMQLTELERSNPVSVQLPAVTAPSGSMVRPMERPLAEPPAPPKRRPLRGLLPVAACLVIAALGFFSVVWLLTPRSSVDSVSEELAKIDFELLQNLPDFNGAQVSRVLPSDAAWQNLQWSCNQMPKGLATAPDAFAVYGFVIPPNRVRNEPIRGLLAVIPRRRVAVLPAAQSLSTASISGYVTARIGESVWVSWTSGDVVCVCLIQGGDGSLTLLQRMLESPAA